RCPALSGSPKGDKSDVGLCPGRAAVPPARAAPPARYGRPAGAAPSQAERGAAPLSLVLDRRRRMGEGSASGGPWGDSLGTGDGGRLEGGSGPTAGTPAPWRMSGTMASRLTA